MNADVQASPRNASRPWRLWVDGCGGFELVCSDTVRIGGTRPETRVEVAVQADWRRYEGTLVRRGHDYLWSPADGEVAGGDSRAVLVEDGQVLPIPGSARLRLHQPSPLSRSAVLSLDPPHRFRGHVDRVLLVDQTVLLGPSAADHVRASGSETSAVLLFRDQAFWIKARPPSGQGGAAERADTEKASGEQAAGHAATGALVQLVPGHRTSIGDLDLTLEER